MRLSDQFIQDWFNQLQINKPEGKKGSNKLRTYKLFKDNFQPEYYLTAVPTVRYRIYSIGGGSDGGLGAEGPKTFRGIYVPMCAFAGRARNRVVNSEPRHVNVLKYCNTVSDAENVV